MKRMLIMFILLVAATVYAQNNGFFDTTFNNGNPVEVSFGYGSPNELRDMAVQPDNKIVVCGWTDNGFGVARINEDGSIDSTFGVDGQSMIKVGERDHCESLEILADGKILLMGNLLYNNRINGNIGLARLNADGSIDSTFGINGNHQFHIQEFSISGYLYDMKLDSSGGVLLAGYRSGGSIKELLLMRLNTDNTLDQNFGKAGYAVVKYDGDAMGTQILLQSDGTIVVVGKYKKYSSYSLTVVRFQANGIIDSTFGENGVVIKDLRFYTSDDAFFNGRLQSDDKLVVAADRIGARTEHNFMAIRFTTTGQIDSSFGTNGLVDVDYYNKGLKEYGQQILIAPNGDVLIGGQAFDSTYVSHFGIVALNASAQIDSTFGTDGRGEMWGGYKMRAMEFDSEGRIVVAGQSMQSGGYRIGRFNYGTQTAIEKGPENAVTNFVLSQNYPNPFNPITHIDFYLPQAGWVTLEVFNTMGQKVAVLLNERKPAGTHSLQFNAANLPSGLYFYTLSAGNTRITKKMLLIK